jgi:hypothetical protein
LYVFVVVEEIERDVARNPPPACQGEVSCLFRALDVS